MSIEHGKLRSNLVLNNSFINHDKSIKSTRQCIRTSMEAPKERTIYEFVNDPGWLRSDG